MQEPEQVFGRSERSRKGIAINRTSARIVYFKTGVEDFAKEEDPSWIDIFTERFSETGNQFTLMWAATDLRFAFGYEDDDLDNFFFALLQDLLNTSIDRAAGECEWDYRKKMDIVMGEVVALRLPALKPAQQYPNLTVVARSNVPNFIKFRDLVNKNKTASLDIH